MFDPKNPNTWNSLASHPDLSDSDYCGSWYDGDAALDIEHTKIASVQILKVNSDLDCHFTLLDDCTFYVSFFKDKKVLFDICPCKNENDTIAFYVEFFGDKKSSEVVSRENIINYINGVMKLSDRGTC